MWVAIAPGSGLAWTIQTKRQSRRLLLSGSSTRSVCSLFCFFFFFFLFALFFSRISPNNNHIFAVNSRQYSAEAKAFKAKFEEAQAEMERVMKGGPEAALGMAVVDDKKEEEEKKPEEKKAEEKPEEKKPEEAAASAVPEQK